MRKFSKYDFAKCPICGKRGWYRVNGLSWARHLIHRCRYCHAEETYNTDTKRFDAIRHGGVFYNSQEAIDKAKAALK